MPTLSATDIGEALVVGAYPYVSNMLRDGGYVVYSYPGHRWTTRNVVELEDGEERGFVIDAKRWLSKGGRAFIDQWTDYSTYMPEFCQRHGIPFFGASTKTVAAEMNRRMARRLLQRAGLPQGHSVAINTEDEREGFFVRAKREYEKSGRLYVIKADYNIVGNDYFNVIVPSTWAEFEWAMTQFELPLSLEERYQGIEIAFTTFACDGKFYPIHTNFEHKRTHTGNLGVNAGEVGTLILRGISPFVMDDLFRRLEPWLERVGPCRTHIDLNTIYDPVNDRWTVLEFTNRMGNPTMAVFSEMVSEPARTLVGWACGHSMPYTWAHNVALGAVLVPGGFPFSNACKQGQPIIFEEEFARSHFHQMGALYDDEEETWKVRGGRQGCLAVGAATVAEAQTLLYDDLKCVTFEDMQVRTDIGGEWATYKDALLKAKLITDEMAEW